MRGGCADSIRARGDIMPHLKAEYMVAIFFLSRANFFLASRGEPYMSPDTHKHSTKRVASPLLLYYFPVLFPSGISRFSGLLPFLPQTLLSSMGAICRRNAFRAFLFQSYDVILKAQKIYIFALTGFFQFVLL